MNKIVFLFLTFSLFYLIPARAQRLLDSISLSHEYEYKSLTEALANPDSVHKLSLKRQKLTTIPQEVYSLPYLQELDLTNNKIKALPPEIARLKNLSYLNVSKNQLETFPKEMGELSNLKTLVASQNEELSSFPPEMSKMESLTYLDIWGTSISEFPKEWSKMKNLKWIDLRTINITKEERTAIEELFPDAKIYLSEGCNCGP
jgi:Leucine-rich repeat (LRR) protein